MKTGITLVLLLILFHLQLGPQILDSMQARFLNTDGMLAEKLMVIK